MAPRQLRLFILDDHRVVEARDVIEWATFFEVSTNRTVGYTEITSEIYVSTVFLGIEHPSFLGKGPPILFETMIFGGPLNEYQWRYSSWDDAEAGHAAAVRKARKAIGQKIRETRP
jgi:hypothetical protein